MLTTLEFERSSADQVLVERDGISLCLLVNRRAQTLRVVDFRAGFSPAKRSSAATVAKSEGIRRLYILVERDEAPSWVRLGFQREGTIPGFYKRSDAHVLGLVLPAGADFENEQSGVHRLGERAPASSASFERTVQRARRFLSAHGGERPSVRLHPLGETETRKAVSAALSSGRAMTVFEPFGRDVTRWYFACTARGGYSLTVSVETQPCFNNAFIELLTAPRSEKEAVFTVAALERLGQVLAEREVIGAFSLSPAENVHLAAAFVGNGFRRTGQLREQLLIDGRRADALLWSRKLAQPTDS
jgi:hypothetical protein